MKAGLEVASVDMVIPIPYHYYRHQNTGLDDNPEVYKSELKHNKRKNQNMVTRNNWPVKLFWLPYAEPVVIPLGLVSSSFLLEKRHRRSRFGCYVVEDNQPRGTPPDRQEKKETPPECQPEDCENMARLRRKAKSVVRFFELDRGLKRAHALPSRIRCGEFRTAIRLCFDSPDLGLADELSLKTACKVEKRICEWCAKDDDKKIDKWKKQRFEGAQVDDDHLSRFRAAFRRNVDPEWNLVGTWPYIPNGHGTVNNDRMAGGNWNAEDLSDDMSIMLALSAGKPRIVTLYSGANTEVLYPLHRALFATLSRKGWLLKGPPTPEKVTSLNGPGEYVSVDYRQATDNIKTAYTREAIEVLIQESVGLTDTQKWALREVGSLKLDGKLATRGQPMGSMMSFPLLCLINKTCVDLALNDLLEDGEISFKEWTSHRCLINGDDLLLKSPTPNGGLTFLPRLVWHGGQVGLEVNQDKTMISSTGLAEINSTLFKDGVLEKKTNAGIFKGGDVSDVLGFADQATTTAKGFVNAVLSMRRNLKYAVNKVPRHPLPIKKWRALLQEARVNPLLKDALTTVVREEPAGNAFPVVECPDGYFLSAEEEKACIEERVADLRRKGYKGEGACGNHSAFFFTNWNVRVGTWTKKSVQGNTSLRKALSRKKTPVVDQTILKVLADYWKDKMTKEMMGEDDSPVDLPGREHVCDVCASGPRIERMTCEIREFKQKKSAGVSSLTLSPSRDEAPLPRDIVADTLLSYRPMPAVDSEVRYVTPGPFNGNVEAILRLAASRRMP